MAPADIAAQDHRLDPSSYVRASGTAPVTAIDPDEVRHRLARLAEEIENLHTRADAADAEASRRLRRYGL